MEFLVLANSSEHPERNGVLWWGEKSEIDPKERFRGELCLITGSSKRIPILSDTPGLETRLRVCFIGRFASDWEKVPVVERGSYFLFDHEITATKLLAPLSTPQLIARLLRKSKLDKRWNGLGALSFYGEPSWKMVAGTDHVLREVEERFLPQTFRECHTRLLSALFRLRVSKKDLQAFAPGLGRAVEYLMEVNATMLEQVQGEMEASRKSFDDDMKRLLVLQRPLFALEQHYQVWLRQQSPKT